MNSRLLSCRYNILSIEPKLTERKSKHNYHTEAHRIVYRQHEENCLKIRITLGN